MMRRVAAAPLVAFAIFSTGALAADLPEIRVSARNQVPACATPGRLMAFLKDRNPKLDPRFEGVATEYMRHGEELGLRWDYAFFQMIVETGYLRFTGDVKPTQNNFAGLGATGGGQRGESFKDISSGVRAHLEHVLMYTGERIENPVAERTRKVQEWNVLTSWRKTIEGPMTFTHLSRKWAPTDRSYSRDIQRLGDAFYSDTCHRTDPRPELVAEARKGRQADNVAAGALETNGPGAEIARRSIEAERSEAGAKRSALGAGSITTPSVQPSLTVLNAENSDKAPAAATGKTRSLGPANGGEAEATVHMAGAADAARQGGKAAAQQVKCRVWTASYGGQKAVIVKAVADQVINYTVLDVNEGAERREADAFIAAYAKGGETIGEFTSQNQALDKAFELCPEG